MQLLFTVGEGILDRKNFFKQLLSLVKDFPIQKSLKSEQYYNIPAAFDIETTSFYQDGIHRPENKRAIMYHWQFGVWNLVTSGRTWEDFISFLDVVRLSMSISEDLKLVVYVHNLPYEFQFMRKRFPWNNVFLLEERKPVYAIVDGIEFRDMLKLAGGRSLESVANDLQKYKCEKMVGDLDYSILRTPLSRLTDKELKYCENDIRVCLCYIMEKIEQDGGIVNIPLTNTGYVRKHCRSKCFDKRGKYKSMIHTMNIGTDEYIDLQWGFQGGFTHANANYVRKILQNVASYDLTSAYPSVMLLERFPMSTAKVISSELTEKEFLRYIYNYCCLFDMELTEVEPKRFQDHPISKAKCKSIKDAVIDNGRVVFASSLKITATEQDYFIYKEFYKWESITISNMRVYAKEYLPSQFTDAILDLYIAKTQLKGLIGEELEYMISKNMLNACYGMAVTNPVRDVLEYLNDDFHKTKADIEKAIAKYNDDKKRFLFYPWGVWVTAYCRANLFSAIMECGNDYVYADTDSVKILNREAHDDYFSRFNNEVSNKINSVCLLRGQDPEIYSPRNRKGKPCTIGVWDFEGVYDEFKTLGAKRYLVRKGNDYTLTVAGTNKKKSCEYLVKSGSPFTLFDDELTIPEESSGRKIVTYIDDEISGWLTDYEGIPYQYDELSSAFMESSEYNMSLSQEFVNYLKGLVVVEEEVL